MGTRALALATLVALHAACHPRESEPVKSAPADLLVSVQSGAVTAPDSVGAGWARVRVEEDGGGHILVIFRLPETMTESAFLAALDTASVTPEPAVALGGPEVGDTGEVVIQFTPGRYVLGCVRRGPEGHRHANTGEVKILMVADAPVAPGHELPPRATQEVRMVDFAYVGQDRWPAGPNMLRVENGGQQDHQLRLARLRSGSSVQDWMNADDPGDVGTAVTGIARLGPGAVAYLPVDLPAGAYVAYCLISDPASGQEHVEMGMLRAIQVE